jgi:multidrug efflux pump subunit AcrA (membrane-fusion protein)
MTAADLRLVREGDTIELRVPEYPELSFAGTVESISPIGRARGDETVFDAEIHVAGDESAASRLACASPAAPNAPLENVLTVPRKAFAERDGRHYVTVDRDGEHEEREITIGPGNDKLPGCARPRCRRSDRDAGKE